MLRNREPQLVDICCAFIIGLLLAFYFSGFTIACSDRLYTVSGGISRYYYRGFPVPCFIDTHEEVPISSEQTLYLNEQHFIPILFLLDWWIYAAVVLLIWNYVKKRKSGDYGKATSESVLE